MKLWDRMRGWVDSNAERLTRHFLDDGGGDVRPHEDYVRVWLADMFLAKDQQWFRSHFPAVTASVRLNYAGRPEQEFTRLVRPPENVRGPGQFSNFALTPLLPYRGGQVEVAGGLTALKGESSLVAGLGILQDLSSLVGPPLTQALGIAGKVASGVDALLDATEGPVLLGTHEGFGAAGGGGQVLRSGYLVCIGAPHGTFAAGQLDITTAGLEAGGAPLEGYDSFVLRIERRATRDDWRFPSFDELLRRAVDALRARDHSAFDAFRRGAIAEAFNSPDLTRADRKLVAENLAEELRDAEEGGLGLAAEDAPTLAAVMERGASAEAMSQRPDRSLEELLNQ
jgi:hypothetical protein